MRENENVADLPEAVPLYRVAPFWRVLAIFGLLGMAGLFVVAATFGIALIQREDATFNNGSVLVPPPPAPPAVMGGRGGPDDDPEQANLPYPVRADLSEPELAEPADEKPPPADSPPRSPRARFLSKGVDVWLNKGPYTDHVLVFPDGKNMAYISGGHLMAGPLAAPRQMDDIETGNAAGGMRMSGPVRMSPARVPVRPKFSVPAPGMPASQPDEEPLRGSPAWSSDHAALYCADAGGRLHRFGYATEENEVPPPSANTDVRQLDFYGDSPVPVPRDKEKLIFVRSRPVPKLDVPGLPVTIDPTEVVVGDLTTKKIIRTLIPSSNSSWHSLAVSPDGERLALVSNRGHEDRHPQLWRVFVLDMQGGEPKPLSPPARRAGPVSWTPDSKALVYARSQDPLPSDCWEGEGPLFLEGEFDLYQWDLETNWETRLSRGGGFHSPSVTKDGTLFYLTPQTSKPSSPLQLRRMSLADARNFAAKEPALPQRDVAAWTGLIDRVLEESKVPLNADGAMLTPQLLAKLVETFHGVYHDRFKTEPPATLSGLRRLRRELQSLSFPATAQERLTLLVGVLEGEYLVHHHGAQWLLTKGSLVHPAKAKTLAKADGSPIRRPAESPFGYVADPFQAARAWTRMALGLEDEGANDAPLADAPEYFLRQAEGRPLVLANDPAAGQAAVAALSDPDLARATELWQQNKTDEAETMLLKMVEKERHKKNRRLVLVVGQLLYEHNRKLALQRLMEQQCQVWPHDARQYNLLGLALLETKPREAIEAFKKAVRCDLHFEPAYLNLAQAYERVNDRDAKRSCLYRYLRLRPDGVYADDARRRLAIEEDAKAGVEE
jgi:hypothetical protein